MDLIFGEIYIYRHMVQRWEIWARESTPYSNRGGSALRLPILSQSHKKDRKNEQHQSRSLLLLGSSRPQFGSAIGHGRLSGNAMKMRLEVQKLPMVGNREVEGFFFFFFFFSS